MAGQLGSTRLSVPQVQRGAAIPQPVVLRPSGIAFGPQVAYLDSGSGTITLSGSSTESQTGSLSATGTLTLSGSKTETWGHNDSGAGTLILAGTMSQSQAHSRSGSGSLTINKGAVSEFNTSSGFSDNPAPSIEFTFSGASTQSLTHSASRSGTIALSGSSTQSLTHSGSGSGTISLSGTATESQQFGYTDAMSGTISFSYFTGTAYPGNFFPGQVYPGQTSVTSPSRDTNTRAATGTLTLTGSGTDSYTFAGSAHFDSGTGTISLSSAAFENLITLDTGPNGTIVLSGSGRDHTAHTLIVSPEGSIGLVVPASGALSLVPVLAGSIALAPITKTTKTLQPLIETDGAINPA